MNMQGVCVFIRMELLQCVRARVSVCVCDVECLGSERIVLLRENLTICIFTDQ